MAFFYDEEQEKATPISIEEFEEIQQSLSNDKQPMTLIDVNGFPTLIPTKGLEEGTRNKRNALMSIAFGRRDRHKDEIELGLTPTEPLLPILEYIQALREVPQQEGFPVNVVWPVPPWESIESVGTTEIEGEA